MASLWRRREHFWKTIHCDGIQMEDFCEGSDVSDRIMFFHGIVIVDNGEHNVLERMREALRDHFVEQLSYSRSKIKFAEWRFRLFSSYQYDEEDCEKHH